MKTSKKASDNSDKCSSRSGLHFSFRLLLFVILILSASCKTEELPYIDSTEYLSGESKVVANEAEKKPYKEKIPVKPTIKQIVDPDKKSDTLLSVKDTLIKEAVLMTFVQYSY